jgi:hypothetical protein
MAHLDHHTRAHVRRALEGDSNDDEHEVLVDLAQAHGIYWYSPETREELEAVLADAGFPRLAERLANGATIDAVRAGAHQEQHSRAREIFEELAPALPADDPPDGDQPPRLVVRLLGDDDEPLAEFTPAGDKVMYSCGDEDEGAALGAPGQPFAWNDRVNPGLWVDGELHDPTGFVVELRLP